MSVTITILTATYNRKNFLKRLYESLVNQSIRDFEWVIIDDGSVDGTEQLVDEFIRDGKIYIKYFYKKNGGKHTAINLGVDNCEGEYIFLVDSDDFLPRNSIQIIIEKINFIKNLDNYSQICGICGDKQDIHRSKFSTNTKEEYIGNYLDFRYKLNIKGDKAEVFKTAILREFKFPEFQGEKFCPEALIWNRIAMKYDMLFIKNIIYFCEYQDGGLTSKIVEIRRKSSKATLLYYKDLFQNKRVPNYHRLRAFVNYLRFKL